MAKADFQAVGIRIYHATKSSAAKATEMMAVFRSVVTDCRGPLEKGEQARSRFAGSALVQDSHFNGRL